MDNACNHLELVHDMHRLYVEWFLISVGFTADVVCNVRILQNKLLIFIGSNDPILEVYHNSTRV
jgi:hypothetical protein